MGTKRLAVFDNAKGLLMLIVVLGHLCSVHFSPSKELYYMIYCFHMPAFVFLSGLVISSPSKTASKTLGQLLIPYIIFAIVVYFTPFGRGFSADIPKFTLTNLLTSLTTPIFSMWYLLALIIWRMLLPLVEKLRFSFVFAVLLALAVGACPAVNRFLALSRVVVFFPYFLLGYKIGLNKINFVFKVPKYVWGIVLAAVFGVILFALYRYKLDNEWLYGMYGYKHFHVSLLKGVICRLFLYVLGFSATFAILGLVPHKNCVLTDWGQHSLVIFLYHMFLFLPFREFVLNRLYSAGIINGWIYLPLALLSAPLICLLLGNKWVYKVLNYPFELLSSLFFKKDTGPVK